MLASRVGLAVVHALWVNEVPVATVSGMTTGPATLRGPWWMWAATALVDRSRAVSV